MKHGKKYREIKKTAKKHKKLPLKEAVEIIKTHAYSEFTDSIDLHINIKVPKNQDPKSIKGSITLPHPPKQEDSKIYVFTKEENKEKALKAGADKAGLDDLIKEVQEEGVNFDIAIATPDVMSKLAVLGKHLGPKGLMPNPKTGTITEDIEKTVEEYKKGKSTIKLDETGVLHISVGKIDTGDDKVIENIKTVISKVDELIKKPLVNTIKSMYIAPTMGPSIEIEYDFDK